MKIKNGFVLRNVAGEYVALPTQGGMDMNTVIALNETGAFLWEKLQQDNSEQGLVDALLAEYDVDEATARKSVQAFVAKLTDNGLLD